MEIIKSSNKIDTCITNSETVSLTIKTILEEKQANIQNVVKTAVYSHIPGTPKPMYSNVVQNKKPAIKNKIITKSQNIDEFDKQLKSKVSPTKENINVTFYKKKKKTIATRL